jgi:uncharacterized protein YhaN
MGLEPNESFVLQREEDIKSNISAMFKRSAILGGSDVANIAQLEGLLGSIREKILLLGREAEERLDAIKACYLEKGEPEYEFEKYKDRLENTGLERLNQSVAEELDAVVNELGSVQLKIKEYETVLRNMEDEGSLLKLEEEIEALEEKKNQLEDTSASLRTALDILTQASSELQRDFVPYLNSSLSRTVNRISGGRYSDLRADEGLNLRAIAPENGEVVSALLLSGGTVDQMYLALRIAAAEIITSQGETLPFMLDEVLAYYDDSRTRETIKFLDELAGKAQILLFTCKKREIEIARDICGQKLNVIELI